MRTFKRSKTDLSLNMLSNYKVTETTNKIDQEEQLLLFRLGELLPLVLIKRTRAEEELCHN